MARKKRALHTAPLAEAELGIWDTALYGRLSVLDNGKAVPISRRKLTQVRNAFLRYLHEKNTSDDSSYHDPQL